MLSLGSADMELEVKIRLQQFSLRDMRSSMARKKLLLFLSWDPRTIVSLCFLYDGGGVADADFNSGGSDDERGQKMGER